MEETVQVPAVTRDVYALSTATRPRPTPVEGVPAVLVVVCGLPGAGKTTVSSGVADRLDAPRLRTDVVRKTLLDDPEYTPAETERVYEELFSRARETVETSGVAVLDGTFKLEDQRTAAATVAESLDVPFRLVKVECAASVVKERIEAREDDESDADFGVHQLHREQFEPIEGDRVVVDNSGSLTETYAQLDRVF